MPTHIREKKESYSIGSQLNCICYKHIIHDFHNRHDIYLQVLVPQYVIANKEHKMHKLTTLSRRHTNTFVCISVDNIKLNECKRNRVYITRMYIKKYKRRDISRNKHL